MLSTSWKKKIFIARGEERKNEKKAEKTKKKNNVK